MNHKASYAAFNTMTDIASRPPQSPRFRRDLMYANIDALPKF
jgi:hypothetical protein